LSGDRASEVNYLAKKLGINNYFSSQSPEQKLEIVKKESQNAPTLFMGDGINDAPALMLASVGIAFGQGNNITSESSGAVILESNLLKVDELIHISIFTRKIILQSAIGGMIFSIVGMILASFGWVSPAQGAIAQQIIDAIAIINALRLTFVKNIHSDLV
jgi:P-type E1-E2 ATPase